MPEPSERKIMEHDKGKAVQGENYRLNNSNDDRFTNRVDSIFGCLDSLEQKHNEAIKSFEGIHDVDDDVEEPCSSNQYEEKNQGNRNGGRKPKRPAPGFVSNPEKWKKYSLKDDGTSTFNDISADQLNSKVAIDLMVSLKKRRENECTDDPEVCDKVEESFVFKVPDLPKIVLKNEEKPVFGVGHAGKARCMETFEFGQSKIKKHASDSNIGRCTTTGDNGDKLSTPAIALNYENIEESGLNDEDIAGDCINGDVADCRGETFKSQMKKKNRVIRKRTNEDEEE